jgi:PAS domain S-box-containing protein
VANLGSILIVEDDLALRKSMALALAKFGFEVAEAGDGMEALQKFQAAAGEIEAMVVDGKMPLLDGFGTCQGIRALPGGEQIPILMATGMSEPQAIEQAYAAGADDFILKPVHLGVLAHRLKHLIGRNRLQRTLDKTTSTLKAVFGSIPSGVIFCDVAGEIEEANPACEKLFGWAPDAMVGLPLKTLFTDAQAAAKLQEEILSHPMAFPIECEVTNAAEKPFWAELVGAPVVSPEGKIQGAVLVVVDATERRKALQERERTAKIDLLGLLAGGIAHDFNNILTAILSSVTLARMELPSDAPAMVYLNDAGPALDQARNLSRQLLTFSKGGAPVRRLCDVKKLLRQTVEFSLRGSKLAPIFAIDEEAWLAEVDEGQLGQVFSNLVVNADQASPQGGRLWVSLENVKMPQGGRLPVGDYLKIAIRDEGIGISPDVLPRIFDPYFTTKKTGNGLGLATVHSIVKRHGGFLEVDSRVGAGTTFTLWLIAAPFTARVEFAPQKPLASNAHAFHKRRVLLLEDQEMIRVSVTRLLEKADCSVVACADGTAAVEAYRAHPQNFDVVILDMTLPGGMNGLEVFQKLRELNREICAVVSTGYADDPVMADPARYGFKGILPKPYTFETLHALLDSLSAKEATV